jgi:anaerobic sulfite reductase subunit B
MATASVAETVPAAMLPRPFRLSARAQDTADTWTLELEPVAGDPPAIAPGQFVMAYAFGIGEVPISVSGATGRPSPVVLTVRAVGAVTRAICDAAAGAVLGLRGPFGNTWPVDAAVGGDIVVVAGGIGLAPLRPVVLNVLERRRQFEAACVLYGARTPGDLLYPSELEGWRDSLEVAVTVDAAGADWRGHVGVVPKLVGAASFRPKETHAFVCGPEVMMEFTVEALLERGVPADRIHLSMERHMDCGIGLCGHCQLGPTLICRDGPVYTYADLASLLGTREL